MNIKLQEAFNALSISKAETGVDNKAKLMRAEKVDLITLPEAIKGTNCGNCEYMDSGYCDNPKVDQKVNERMCCALWDNKDVRRSWEIKKDVSLNEMG